MRVYYNPKLKERARKLRKNVTYSKCLLWKYLRNRQMLGYQFMRQKPIENYIVDFYCSKLHFVIEIDGVTHSDKQAYDEKREKELKSIGLEALRFEGYYLINNIAVALKVIEIKIYKIEGKTTPYPHFLRGTEF